MAINSQNTIQYAAKPRFYALDGLRGVAALIVICHHVFEAFATSPIDMGLNHGYLAVDFFFILSGFVVAYSYDDRWKPTNSGTRMTIGDFFRRRLIRLHPMVIFGAILGVITYCIQGRVQWDGTETSISALAVAFILSILMLPCLPGAFCDVRGNTEIFPLNGPTWSLFFEYIGNIFYALILRRLSTKTLSLVVGTMAICYCACATGNISGYGHMGVGWSFADYNLIGGIVRVGFCFSAGLLLARTFVPSKIKGSVWLCTAILIAVMAMPHFGGDALWLNGIYDTICTVLIFPLIVCLGASDNTSNQPSRSLFSFLGEISYPLYAIHYPTFYLFYAWVWKHGYTFSQTLPVAIGLVAFNIVFAYLVLRFYDKPVRQWLSRRTASIKTV